MPMRSQNRTIRNAIRQDQEAVRRIVNASELPPGGAPSDECDDLVNRIISVLHNRGDRDARHRVLTEQIREQGLSARLAEQMTDWWESRTRAG